MSCPGESLLDPEPEAAPWRAPVHWQTALAAVVLVGAIRAVLPIIPVPPRPAAVAIASLAYFALLLGAGAGLAAIAQSRRRWAFLLGALFACIALAARVGVGSGPLTLLVRAGGDWMVFLAAVLLGTAASGIVREPNLLPPIALTAIVVDYVAIRFGGPTVQMLAAHPDIVEGASTSLPALGAAVLPLAHGARMGLAPTTGLAIVGPGDLLFLGLAFGAVARYGFRFTPSVLFTVVGGLIGMSLVLWSGLALPGLPFIAIGCIAPNVDRFRYTRAELLSLAVMVIFLAAFCLGLVLHFGGGPPPSGPGSP